MFSKVKKYFYKKPTEIPNIDQIFKPLYIVLSLFGLFPYSIRFNNKRGVTIIKNSIYLNSLCAVSHILLLLSFLVLHVQYVYDCIGDTVMTRELLTQMNYIVELVIFIVFCLSAYICAFKNRLMFVKIINKIANNTDPTSVEKALKQFRNQMNFTISFLIAVFLLQILVNFTRDDSFWKMILVFITFTLPQMIQFTILAFYHMLIMMLLVLLKNIRVHIINLAKDKIIIMDYFLKTESKVITLQNLESLYQKAFEIKKDINVAFQAPLLITTLQCFHTIVSESHIIYHGVVVERDFTLHPIINCSIWIIYQILKVQVMGRTGSLLKQEVLKIGQALHNIPTEKHDIRLLLEVQHFSSLILHQNDEITAFGLVTLDAALLSKIIASSAMYLTILVQFDRK
nr:gustatory receptor 68a [Helicoverpa armigera]